MGKKVAVTGGCGFIGSHVVANLKLKGFEVAALDRAPRHDIYFDLGKEESIVSALKDCRPDFVVHLASPAVQGLYRCQKEYQGVKISEIIDSEIKGSYVLYTIAEESGVKKIIFGSSASVYGRNDVAAPFVENMVPKPQDLYGALKLAVEEIGNVSFPSLINLRFFQVFGRGDMQNRLIPSVMSAKEGSELSLTPCQQISDLIHVKDVAECIGQMLVGDDVPPGTYNLGSGHPVQLRDVVELIIKLRGVNIKPNYQAKSYSGNEVKYSVASMDLLHSVCKWRPRFTLEEALNNMLEEAGG